MTDETETEFDEFIESERPVALKVQKPMDEVMDAGEGYSTALRHNIGTGDVSGHELSITVGMGGVVRIEYDDGPNVWFEMDALVSAATDAALDAGYLEDVAQAAADREQDTEADQ